MLLIFYPHTQIYDNIILKIDKWCQKDIYLWAPLFHGFDCVKWPIVDYFGNDIFTCNYVLKKPTQKYFIKSEKTFLVHNSLNINNAFLAVWLLKSSNLYLLRYIKKLIFRYQPLPHLLWGLSTNLLSLNVLRYLSKQTKTVQSQVFQVSLCLAFSMIDR